MRELITSMIRFSGAVAMFSLEQVQNAVSAPSDTQRALTRLCDTLNGMSKSLVSKLDEPKRAAFESMTRSQTEILDGAADAVNLDVAGDLMKKTSESLASVLGRSNGHDPSRREEFS